MTYLVFAGARYYAQGGWRDFRGFHDNLEAGELAADAAARIHLDGWAHVVDLDANAIVYVAEAPPRPLPSWLNPVATTMTFTLPEAKP